MTKFNEELNKKIKELTKETPKFDTSKIDLSKLDAETVDTNHLKDVLNTVLSSLKEISNFDFGSESDIKRAEMLLTDLKSKTTSVTDEIDERIKNATKKSKEEENSEPTDEDLDSEK